MEPDAEEEQRTFISKQEYTNPGSDASVRSPGSDFGAEQLKAKGRFEARSSIGSKCVRERWEIQRLESLEAGDKSELRTRLAHKTLCIDGYGADLLFFCYDHKTAVFGNNSCVWGWLAPSGALTVLYPEHDLRGMCGW